MPTTRGIAKVRVKEKGSNLKVCIKKAQCKGYIELFYVFRISKVLNESMLCSSLEQV